MASNLRILLDTSAFLWAAGQSSKLSPAALHAISDSKTELFVSMASVWEMQIKHALGKLPLAQSADESAHKYIHALEAELLPISIDDIAALYLLPFVHRDPFDRILAAQAISQSLTLVSPDAVFSQYPVKRLW